ncbi:MAG: site-specific DNA-methyltransferase [archaeon]|nr:site-specific DNA-methyltransferase [archaeon]
MKSLPDGSVNLCVTSPPYWGLRDYGVEGQIGLEPDFHQYISKLVTVFCELKRVLRHEGSFYLNLGDTYSHSGGAGGQYEKYLSKNRLDGLKKYGGHKAKGLPAKCLIGIPWRVALALTRKGLILRNDIIWHKPNALPSSVKDRLTNTYEHIFHFVKSRKYYYNLNAIRIPHKTDLRGKHPGDVYEGKLSINAELFSSPRARLAREGYETDSHYYHPKGKNPGDIIETLTERQKNLIKFFKQKGSGGNPGHGIEGSTLGSTHSLGKNPGDFWLINTKPFKGAHFSVYPEELCVTPILSSSRLGDIVLDPFIGSGTTAVVAKKLGRHYLGCDINPEYVRMAEKRIESTVVIA